jgi:Zn-dependent M16 (insulinase) family peptidase
MAWGLVSSCQLSGDFERVTQFQHASTAAQHVHVEMRSADPAFGLVVPTAASNDSGISHATEHLVGAGSRRYPVRAPFYSMMWRSSQSFLNNLTFADMTVYAFATPSIADFFDLLDVYLDGIFFPLLRAEEFAIEIWRRQESGMSGGVLINEMLSVRDLPGAAMERAIGSAIYPDTCYARAHGGRPDAIPSLSVEDVRSFHRTHYQPGSCLFFTGGAIPVERALDHIHRRVLSSFDRHERTYPEPQLPFTAPRRWLTADRAIPERDRLHILVGWMTGSAAATQELWLTRLMWELLFNGGPVSSSLSESGLGTGSCDGIGLHERYQQPCVATGLCGVAHHHAELVEEAIMDALQAPPSAPEVKRALERLRRRWLRMAPGRVPAGVRALLRIAPTWMGGGDVAALLDVDQAMHQLERVASEGGLSPAIDQFLVSNRHRVRVELEHATDPAGSEDSETSLDEFVARRRRWIVPVYDSACLPRSETRSDQPTWDESAPPVSINGLPTSIVTSSRSSTVRVRVSFTLQSLPPELVRFASSVPVILPNLLESAEKRALRLSSTHVVRARQWGSAPAFRLVVDAMARPRDATLLGEKVAKLLDEPVYFGRDLADWQRSIGASCEQDIRALANYTLPFATMLAAAPLSRSAGLDEMVRGHDSSLARAELRRLSSDVATARLREVTLASLRNATSMFVSGPGSSVDDVVAVLANTCRPPAAQDGSVAVIPPKQRRRAIEVDCGLAQVAMVLRAPTFHEEAAPAAAVLAELLTATAVYPLLRDRVGAYGAQVTYDFERGYLAFTASGTPDIEASFEAFRIALNELWFDRLSLSGFDDMVATTRRRFDTMSIAPSLDDETDGYGRKRWRHFTDTLPSVSYDSVKQLCTEWNLTTPEDSPSFAVVAPAAMIEHAERLQPEGFERLAKLDCGSSLQSGPVSSAND